MPFSPSPNLSVSPSSAPRLSVVVPLYNCLPLTQAMLASLQATLPAGLSHEIIFVDDGSTDGTRDWLESLSPSNGLESLSLSNGLKGLSPSNGLKSLSPLTGPATPFRVLLNERNLGYAVSNNRGVASAQGELLALLNNDLVLLPGWLEPMLEAHTRLAGRAGLIGNVQFDALTGAVDHAGLELTPTAKPVHVRTLPPLLSRLLQPVRPVPAVTGACVLVERALWRQLGGFDEGYVNGGEDIDLCYRARAAGRVNAVALRSVVRHHVSSSPGRKARDEQNSHRLALRWRAEFAADAILPWCRDFLAKTPHSSQYKVALATCAYLAHLRRTPPPEAIKSVNDNLAREFARWNLMFAKDA